MSRRVARALMAAFSRFVHPEILNFVSTPRMVRVEAAGDGARERVLGHVTRGATGCRRHVKAFQAGHAVIRLFGTRVRTERIVGAWPVICTI